MSTIRRTPPHENRSNMSAEHDDQDIELVEHQQLNRGVECSTKHRPRRTHGETAILNLV